MGTNAPMFLLRRRVAPGDEVKLYQCGSVGMIEHNHALYWEDKDPEEYARLVRVYIRGNKNRMIP